MRRRTVILGILPFIAGCVPDIVRLDQDLPTVRIFNLFGTVRDFDNVPLLGAKVTLTNGSQNKLEAYTDIHGRYEILGITGSWNVAVTYDGFVAAVSIVDMSVNRVLDFKMIRLPRAVAFEVGKEFDVVISATDAPCDPVHWDASAPCVRMRLQAPRTGQLTVSVTWASTGDVDFTIMSDDERAYLAYSGSGEQHTLTTSLGVTAGTYYVIWIHSYYGAASFKIRADIVP